MVQKCYEIDKKVLFRRLVALPLVVLLAFLPSVPVVHASDPVTAASLAVTGGQLAAGGLTGEALISTLGGPVGVVVGVTLAACGLNAVVGEEAAAAGKTRSQFVLDKLVIWGAQAGYTKEQIIQRIANGITVAADGTIALTREVADSILQFGNWAFTQDGLVVPSLDSPGASTDQYTYGNATISMSTQWVFIDSLGRQISILDASAPVAVEIALENYGATRYFLYVYSFVQGATFSYSVPRSTDGAPGRFYTGTCSSRFYNQDRSLSLYSAGSIGLDGYTDHSASTLTYPSEYPNFIQFWVRSTGDLVAGAPAVPSEDVFTGTPENWAQNADLLNPALDSTPVVLNPDLLNPIIDSLADGQQATMSIIDYLQALQDAWDHALDDVQTAIGTITDSLTGIREQIAVPQDAVSNPTITNPSVTPDTAPILDPSNVDPGTVITGFQFDLTEIFPFCLPFDVYKMLRLLDADPVAPSYRFQFDVPIPGMPGHSAGSWHFDYTIDLAQFNAVAALLRKLELLSFCIGLAYVTRSMFIRS